jgi:hypothetical protein
LKTFTDLIKSGDMEEAVRFIDEDLPQVRDALKYFNEFKDRRIFKEKTSEISGLPSDPTNINNYDGIGQLYKAIEPFIKETPGEIGESVKHFIETGEAKILYEDSRWIVYIPLTREANCVIGNISSICTSKEGNTFFDSYSKNNPEPDGKPSKFYVIMNKNVLKDLSKEVYQFHFETNQFRNRFQTGPGGETNRNMDWVDFLNKNPGLRKFFISRIGSLAIKKGGNITNNKYLQRLLEMGETDTIFDYFDTDTIDLDLSGLKLPKLPNELNKFKNTKDFNARGVGLTEIPTTIGDMNELNLLNLKDNKLKSMPESIGNLKNIEFIILSNNQFKTMPNSIKNLDSDNGGKLIRLDLKLNDFNETEKEKIRSLLPNAEVVF